MKPYSSFIFDSFSHNAETGTIALAYSLDGSTPKGTLRVGLTTGDEIRFVETLTLPFALPPLPSGEGLPALSAVEGGVREALHALHLIGGISYYKTCLPKKIAIRTTPLSPAQAAFWNTMYEEGLGEFFYKNKIDFRNFIHFPSEPGLATRSTPPLRACPEPDEGGEGVRGERVLVPIGGGKDSVVTAELLRSAGFDVTLFRVGQHPVIDRLAEAMGLPLLTVKRSLSPNLFKLNAEGALNGHVPITGYLSILAVVTAILGDFDAVVMSNERSASVGNTAYLGKEINHQWSKGLACERMLREYLSTYIDGSIAYFSLLRPWSELRITQEFIKYPQYLPLTTSCNTNWKILGKSGSPLPLGEGRGGEGGLWCGTCPKCAFVFALYAAFLPRQTLINTFGNDLFSDPSLLPLYKQLLGVEGFKPFECVGTPEETAAAFLLAHKRGEWEGTPVMEYFQQYIMPVLKDPDGVITAALHPSPDHLIPSLFQDIIHHTP